MLQFENVSKSFLFRDRMRPVLSNATFTAHFQENFGLVIPPRSGATTIQNLILGAEQPDAGKVYRYGKISWPVGGVNGLIEQTRSIERVITALNADGIEIEGSDSLDNPDAVFE